MDGFTKVASIAELGAGPVWRCLEDGTTVVLVRLPAGDVHAFANSCPHLGQPLSDGEVADGVLTCAHHGYAYACDTGRNVAPERDLTAPLTRHEVRVRAGDVWVGPSHA
jgi:nitrite reductase/ring-hydroxylating ferredoxin subunit